MATPKLPPLATNKNVTKSAVKFAGTKNPPPAPKKQGVLYSKDPTAPGGINYTGGPQKGKNGVLYAVNPKAPGGINYTGGPKAYSGIPQRVTGSINLGFNPFTKKGATSKPKALPPTTDKVKKGGGSPPPLTVPSANLGVDTAQTTAAATPPLSLPGLGPAATYQPVAAPPLYTAVKTPNVDPYAGRSAAQVASAELAPQYAALAGQQTANQAALTGFTKSVLDALKGLPQATANDYTQAQNVTEGLASKASELLSGANPNAADQAILQSINAPASQQQAIAAQLQNTFGGGAGVLYDTAGANAGSALAAQKAAALSFANAQPGIQGLAATQAERNLLYQNAQQKAAIAAQFPTIANQVDAAKANALYNEAQFTASQHAAVNQSASNRSTFQAGQNAAVASNALQKAAYRQNNAALGIKSTTAATNAEIKALPAPSATWSRALGYKADQYGNPVLVGGRPQLLPGYKIKNGVVVKSGAAAKGAKPISDYESHRLYEGVSNMQAGFVDKKGKQHPPLDYNSALNELKREGYFRNPTRAAAALKALNTAYGKPIHSNNIDVTSVPGNESIAAQSARLGINPGA